MHGFSLVELLITIAIIGILAAMIMAVAVPARHKAIDARIRNDVAQLRWQAEIVYDSQGANYTDWASHTTVADNVSLILSDIDEALGETGAATIKDSNADTYCVSAPLVSEPNRHYCIDAQGTFEEVGSPCPASPPFECQI